MSTYAIGDVQGCNRELRLLLRQFDFDARTDRLWFVGDLVNRGPDSRGVLRFVRSLGDAATVVLGNHDLHLLACAFGVRKPSARDTFDDVLDAPDFEDLIEWLRDRPLLHVEDGYALVHAGLEPDWSIADAAGFARRLERRLRDDRAPSLLRAYRRGPWRTWGYELAKSEQLTSALRFMTRVRCLDRAGAPDGAYTGGLRDIPPNLLPWFAWPGRRSTDHTIVFGHWAALGLHLAHGLVGLDTGCVWGRSLTAIRLEDAALFHEPAR